MKIRFCTVTYPECIVTMSTLCLQAMASVCEDKLRQQIQNQLRRSHSLDGMTHLNRGSKAILSWQHLPSRIENKISRREKLKLKRTIRGETVVICKIMNDREKMCHFFGQVVFPFDHDCLKLLRMCVNVHMLCCVQDERVRISVGVSRTCFCFMFANNCRGFYMLLVLKVSNVLIYYLFKYDHWLFLHSITG